MKFKKLSLDESLFEDFMIPSVNDENIEWVKADEIFGSDKVDITPVDSTYDDDFSAPEYMPQIDNESIPEGPKQGSDMGVSDLLISAINDEWEAIRQYNSLVATLKVEVANYSIYESFVNVINDITNEENKHVGQLQELLSKISPNTESIQLGQQEGEAQNRLSTGGILPVESWDNVNNNSTSTQNHVDEACSISDVDDEM